MPLLRVLHKRLPGIYIYIYIYYHVTTDFLAVMAVLIRNSLDVCRYSNVKVEQLC